MDIMDAIRKHHDRITELSEVLTSIPFEDKEAQEMICAEIQKELQMHEYAAEEFYLGLSQATGGTSLTARKTTLGDCDRLLKDICDAQDECGLLVACGKLQAKLTTYKELENQNFGWSSSDMDEIQLENWGREYLLKKKKISRPQASSWNFSFQPDDSAEELFPGLLISLKQRLQEPIAWSRNLRI